jgi:hypothetical protein
MISCILTRYNEIIDWIEYVINDIDFFYIYNKGDNDILFKNYQPPPEKIKIIKLPNIGRIDHTIAYHILENWGSLDDTIVCLPGSILMCKMKGAYLSAIRKNLKYINKYRGYYSPRFIKVGPQFNYSIDNYHAEGKCNYNDNLFIKSEYPDFQTWKKAIIDERPMHYVSMRGMFVVNKENIEYISRQIYENLLTSLSVGDNIENGHFAERIWAHLFRQWSFDSTICQDSTIPQDSI